jgi:hypothetical protein
VAAPYPELILTLLKWFAISAVALTHRSQRSGLER